MLIPQIAPGIVAQINHFDDEKPIAVIELVTVPIAVFAISQPAVDEDVESSFAI